MHDRAACEIRSCPPTIVHPATGAPGCIMIRVVVWVFKHDLARRLGWAAQIVLHPGDAIRRCGGEIDFAVVIFKESGINPIGQRLVFAECVDVRTFRLTGLALQDANAARRHAETDEVVVVSVMNPGWPLCDRHPLQ